MQQLTKNANSEQTAGSLATHTAAEVRMTALWFLSAAVNQYP
jgi:hypothetical protein